MTDDILGPNVVGSTSYCGSCGSSDLVVGPLSGTVTHKQPVPESHPVDLMVWYPQTKNYIKVGETSIAPKKLLVDKIVKLMDEISAEDLSYILYHNRELKAKLKRWVDPSYKSLSAPR